MLLEINETEKKLLIDLLSNEIDELKDEIHHTDDYYFREKLKEKLKYLEELKSKIKDQ